MDTVFVDSSTIFGYENQGYIKNRYLRICDYMITMQSTFSIYEFKMIIFDHKEYLLFSNISGIRGFSSYNNDSLAVFRIENNHPVFDNSLKLVIDKFRNFKYFTDDINLIKSQYKEDFIFEFGENENEISIKINLSDYSYKEFNDKLNGNKLILQFNNKIDTLLTDD